LQGKIAVGRRQQQFNGIGFKEKPSMKARKPPRMLFEDVFQSLPESMQSAALQTPVFRIDNVAEYLYEGTDQERWYEEDLPNIAPPFPTWWMEFQTPQYSISRDHGKVPNPPGMVGLWFTAPDLQGDEDPSLSGIPPAIGQTCRDSANSPVRWILHVMVYRPELAGNTPYQPLLHYYLAVDDQGRHALWRDADPDRDSYHRGLLWSGSERNDLTDEDKSALSGMTHIQVLVGLLAVSFLHCRNVTIEDHNPLPRKIKNRATVSIYHGEPVIHHKTLHIHAMRRVLDGEGGRKTVGLMRALHICRGHFKTFEADAPLFGKHTGTYWWNSMVRGSPQHGTLEKTYDVHPPDHE
jgi:hypothetical protein